MTTARRRPRSLSLRAKLILLVVSCCLTAGVGEWILRITVRPIAKVHHHFELGAIEADAILGYRLTPDHSSIMTNGFFREQVITNDLGQRDLHDSSLPERGYVAIGDSTAFGHGVAAEETWPEQLQRKLGINVVNAGVFGYGINHYKPMLESYARTHPVKHVLYGISWNDVISGTNNRMELTVRDGALVRADGVTQDRLRAMLRRSAALSLLADLAKRIGAALLEPEPDLESEVRRRAQATREELAAIHDWVTAQGGELTIVYLANHTMARPDVYENWSARFGDLAAFPHELLARWCEERGIGFADATSALRERYAASANQRTSIVLPVDYHYGPGGYDVVSDQFVELLSRD